MHRSKAVPLFDHLVGGRKQDGGTVRPRSSRRMRTLVTQLADLRPIR
jgi:hypothetical protein